MPACVLQWLLRRIPGVAAMLDSMPTPEDIKRAIDEALAEFDQALNDDEELSE